MAELKEHEGTKTVEVVAEQLVASQVISSMSTEERRAKERKLVRKIDLHLLPAIIIMYLLNYIDRNNIAAARLAGLEEDLGLKGNEYQTCQYSYRSHCYSNMSLG
jgi:hypothetical protein